MQRLQECAANLLRGGTPYAGLKLALTNFVSSPGCGIAITQLVHYDGLLDPSVQPVSRSPAALPTFIRSGAPATYFSLKYGPFVCFVQGDVELKYLPPALISRR